MSKKSRFRAGLGFGIAMAVCFIIQNILVHDLSTAKEITKVIVAGIIGGLISGLLFGWLIGLFIRSKFVKEGTKFDVETNEILLFETFANHFKGIEGVGGKLYLTDRRLIFQSHKLNVQTHQLSIPLSQIQNVVRNKTIGLINNGLMVTTNNKTV